MTKHMFHNGFAGVFGALGGLCHLAESCCDGTIQFRCQAWSASRRMALLAVASLPWLDVGLLRADATFTKISKAVWVWKDRILAPDDLASFCERYQVGVLFLYLTPQAGEALLSGADNAQKVMASLRTGGRRVYACVGEPDWVIDPVRLPDHLALAARAVSTGLFDGLHLDVEPHALPAWRDAGSRASLLTGTVELLDLVRSALSDADIDAAVNPSFATVPYLGESFLTALARRLTSISIMSYRDSVSETIKRAMPSIREISRLGRRWRLGVLVDPNSDEPGTSWSDRSASSLGAAMDELDGILRSQFSSRGYSGLAFEGYDGLKLIEQKSGPFTKSLN
jgi:hypothetical protein